MIINLRKYPLRIKLIILYAILLVISVVLVSYYSYWDIWQILINNKVTHLRARAKPIIEHWVNMQHLTGTDCAPIKLSAQQATLLARDLTSRYTVAVILNRQGKIIANGKRLPEEPTPPSLNTQYFHKALNGINDIAYLDYLRGKRVLVFLIPLRPQPASKNIFGVIQMSTSLADINKILFKHGSRQIAAVIIILFLGILFGYWLIGISLQELKDLSDTCQDIARGHFDKRADIRNRNDEIGNLAQSFNLMIEKIETLFNAQKRFVANATHELLTPLTGLRGSLEVLMHGAQDDPKTVNRLTKGMYKEVNHLIRLCDQLLGLSRLENALHVNRKRIDLNFFFETFGPKARQLAPNHSIVIHHGPSASVLADPILLEQILYNLVSNAVRYSPPNASIAISWKLFTDCVEFRVTDHGIGMDKETLAHVFEPFFRGKSQDYGAEKGSGLGLALTQSMVKAHGGDIHIESKPDIGTTVFFTIPI